MFPDRFVLRGVATPDYLLGLAQARPCNDAMMHVTFAYEDKDYSSALLVPFTGVNPGI